MQRRSQHATVSGETAKMTEFRKVRLIIDDQLGWHQARPH